MPRMTQGWLAVLQLLTSPVVALATVKLTMKSEIRKSFINGSFSTKQAVYEDLYGVVSLVNRKMNSINIDLWISPNIEAIDELEEQIERYDSYDIEGKIAIYGTSMMKKIVDSWVDEKVAFLGLVTLVQSGTLGKGKNRVDAKKNMKTHYDKCISAEKNLLGEIQRALGLLEK